MRDVGRMVEEGGTYRLYECIVDETFSKVRGRGYGIGCMKAGKGMRIMVLVDARGLPVALDTMSTSPHESTLVQHLFDFMLPKETPERISSDKAYYCDKLDQDMHNIYMIAPHQANKGP